MNSLLFRSLTVCIAIALVVAVVFFGAGPTKSEDTADVLTHVISRSDLDVVVTENGTVESSNNKEIKCMVKGGSTVLWVIETGTMVKPGDVLVRLDQSQIEDNILAKQITYENALANKITAESNVAVAEKSITEYLEGTYVRDRQTIEKDLFDARQTVTQAKLAYGSAERLAAKGLIKNLQLEQEAFRVESALKALQVKQTELETLEKYQKEKELQTLKSNLRAAEAQLASFEASLQLEKARLDREKEQLKNCTITADVAGMVIFPSMAEWKDTPDIEEGAVVREQQTLLMIPDVTKMQVKVGIHESKVDRLKLGMPAQVQLQDLTLTGAVAEIAEVTKPAGWWTGNLVKYDTVIELPEREGLKPGMSAIVDVILSSHDDVVTVPVAAVLAHDGGHSCWVKQDETFVRREIEIGETNDKFNIVLSGLDAGDEVALNPSGFLAEAQRKAFSMGGEEESEDQDEAEAGLDSEGSAQEGTQGQGSAGETQAKQKKPKQNQPKDAGKANKQTAKQS